MNSKPRVFIWKNLNILTRETFGDKNSSRFVFSLISNLFHNLSIKDARENNRVMSGPIEPGCPVCIIHGSEDIDVPVKLVDKLVKMLPSTNQTKRINVADGDHRLSRPEVSRN